MDLKGLSESETEGLAIRRSLVDDVPEVQCFVEDMKDFFQVTSLYQAYYVDPSYLYSCWSLHTTTSEKGLYYRV